VLVPATKTQPPLSNLQSPSWFSHNPGHILNVNGNSGNVYKCLNTEFKKDHFTDVTKKKLAFLSMIQPNTGAEKEKRPPDIRNISPINAVLPFNCNIKCIRYLNKINLFTCVR
jgi:hypothetical protein